MAPLPNRPSGTFAGIHPEAGGRPKRGQVQHATLASALALSGFDLLVCVMSVLKRYSENEYEVLLGCSRQDVREARIRASQQIAEYTTHAAAEPGDSIQSVSRSLEMLMH